VRPLKTKQLSFFGKQGLQGGLNVSDNPILVAPQQMTQATNVLIGQTLARRKRGGLDQYNTTDLPGTPSYPPIDGVDDEIRGLIQYWRYGASSGVPEDDLFLHQNDKVYSIPNRTDAAVDRTGALTLSTDGIPSYQVFEGVLYFASSNVADGYNKWDGTVAVPGDAVAATGPLDGPGKYLMAHNGRMWMGGNPDFPFRLYYSAALDADDWTGGSGGGSLDLDYDGDPDGITAIFPPFQGRLYVATRRTVYDISGNDPASFAVSPVTKGIGCVSHQAVAGTPNDIIFPSDRGIHSLRRVQVSDQSEVDFLSRDIQKLWTDLTNRTLLMRTQAAWDENINSYIITVAGAGQQTQNLTLVYNLEFGTWTTWDNIQGRSVALLLLNNQSFIGFGREDGQITFVNPDRENEFNDEGINFSFTTGKIYPDGAIEKQYRFLSLTIFASATRASSISVDWTVDGIDGQTNGSKGVDLANDTDQLGSTFVLGQSQLGFGQFLPKRITTTGVGYSIEISIRATGDSDIEFYGYLLEVKDADSHYV